PSMYDQLNVTGSVALSTVSPGVILNVTSFGGFAPAGGDTFVIIKNDSGDAVSGTFAGLPEGAVVSTNFLGSGLVARITYKGGDGNDVGLTVIGPAVYNSAGG